jgi:hypothetical protein
MEQVGDRRGGRVSWSIYITGNRKACIDGVLGWIDPVVGRSLEEKLQIEQTRDLLVEELNRSSASYPPAGRPGQTKIFKVDASGHTYDGSSNVSIKVESFPAIISPD